MWKLELQSRSLAKEHSLNCPLMSIFHFNTGINIISYSPNFNYSLLFYKPSASSDAEREYLKLDFEDKFYDPQRNLS